MKKVCCDWSSLQVDIINKICQLLPFTYRIWLRIVCKPWCFAIPPIRIPFPWLLLPGDGPEYGEYTDSFTFYSIINNTTFKCPFPPGINLSGMHSVGSQGGWLVVCNLYFNICLVNPMTGVRIDLPPFTSNTGFDFAYTRARDGFKVLCGFRDYRLGDDEGNIVHSFDHKECYVQKIVLSSDPRRGDFMALALFGAGNLAFLRANGNVWDGLPKPRTDTIQDIAFRGGKFWAVSANAEITSFDFSRKGQWGKWYFQMPNHPIFDAHKFIVFDSDDKLYMIVRNGDFQMHSDGKYKFHTKSFTVMKNNLDIFGYEIIGSWDPVEDLDGHSVVIGTNHGFFVSPEEYPQLKRNCVYVTSIRNKDEIFDIGVYDMEKKRFESIYLTDMESNWAQPPPIWFSLS